MLGPRQKQLVDALRSGRFIQGTGCLQSVIDNDSAYCCLGVACKIAEENDIPVVYDSNAKIYGKTLFNQPSVKSWYGFMTNSVVISGGINLTNLTTLNDNVGLNFSEIADVIEKHTDSIFTEPL